MLTPAVLATGDGTVSAVGGTTGYDYASQFLGRRSVRDTWIALWVLWMLWALLFLARQMFGPPRFGVDGQRVDRMAPTTGAVAPDAPYADGAVPAGAVAGEPIGAARPVGVATERKGFFGRAAESVRERVERTYRLIRDLTLMLLLVVTLNTFGLGSGVFVLTLAWIYTAFAFMWAGLLMLVDSRILDVLIGSIEMLLLLAMLISAYTIGWNLY